MEKRVLNVTFSKMPNGGYSGRLCIPASWLKNMDINKDNKEIEIVYDDKTKSFITKKFIKNRTKALTNSSAFDNIPLVNNLLEVNKLNVYFGKNGDGKISPRISLRIVHLRDMGITSNDKKLYYHYDKDNKIMILSKKKIKSMKTIIEYDE